MATQPPRTSSELEAGDPEGEVVMLILTNDRELMGEHVNSRRYNIIAWATVAVMIGLTLTLIVMQR